MKIESRNNLYKELDHIWQRLIDAIKDQEPILLEGKERTFFLAYWLYGEVGNGNFDQFYYNSTGDYSLEMVSALEEIGAYDAARILSECNRIFPNGVPPQNRDERIQALDALPSNSIAFLNRAGHELMDDSDFLLRIYHYYVTGEKISAAELRTVYYNFYAGERFFQDLSKRPENEQFDFLLKKIKEMMMVPFSERYFLDKRIFEIRTYLLNLAYFDEKAIVEIIERFIYKPGFNKQGSKAFDDFGAFTREADLTLELLKILERKAEPSDNLEIKLQDWFVKLLDVPAEKSMIWLNLKYVAVVLHSLWETKYPEPIIGPSDNKLLNAEVYLKAINSHLK